MSLQTRHIPSIPELTAQVAKAAFRKGNVYMQMRDLLGAFFTNDQVHRFVPCLWRLALVSVMQFAPCLRRVGAQRRVSGQPEDAVLQPHPVD